MAAAAKAEAPAKPPKRAKSKRQRLEEQLATWTPEDEQLANIDPDFYAWHHAKRSARAPAPLARSYAVDSLDGRELTELLKPDVNYIVLVLALLPMALVYVQLVVVVFVLRGLANLLLYFSTLLPDNRVADAVVDFLIWLTEGGE